MLFSSRHLALLACATAGMLATTCCVQAGDAEHFWGTAAPAPDSWQAIDHCAVYGPDFASVAGSDACVRIGGRVHVEFSFHKYSGEPNSGFPNSRAAVIRSDGPADHASDGPDGLEQGHLRVQGLDNAASQISGQVDQFH